MQQIRFQNPHQKMDKGKKSYERREKGQIKAKASEKEKRGRGEA